MNLRVRHAAPLIVRNHRKTLANLVHLKMASSSSVVPLTPRASIRAGSLVVDSDDLGTPKEGAGAVERMAEACRVLIESIGEDVSRPGLEKTPMRMARALLAITSGYSLVSVTPRARLPRSAYFARRLTTSSRPLRTGPQTDCRGCAFRVRQ